MGEWCIKNGHENWCKEYKKTKKYSATNLFMYHFKVKVDGNNWQEQVKPMIKKDVLKKHNRVEFTKLGKKWCEDNAHDDWCRIFFFYEHFQEKEQDWDKKILSMMGGRRVKKKINVNGLKKWESIKPLSAECKFKIRESHEKFMRFWKWVKKNTNAFSWKDFVWKDKKKIYKPYSGLFYAKSPFFTSAFENTNSVNARGEMLFDLYESFQEEIRKI